jgi:hypothetical protein
MARRGYVPPDAGKVRVALRARYKAAEYALFEEVGNATGSKCNRHADAVALSLWPSRGLYLHGFEIKVSRSDWLAEKRNPEKAEEVARYCDFWWLVVGDAEIVKEGELPEPWGLLVMKGDALELKKQASKLDAAPLDRPFLAALLRRAGESVPALVAEAEARGFVRGAESGPRDARLDQVRNELGRLKESLAEFEQKSGVKIDGWSGGRIGEAVAKLLKSRNRHHDPAEDLKYAAAHLERTAEMLREAEKSLRGAAALVPGDAAE